MGRSEMTYGLSHDVRKIAMLEDQRSRSRNSTAHR